VSYTLGKSSTTCGGSLDFTEYSSFLDNK